MELNQYFKPYFLFPKHSFPFQYYEQLHTTSHSILKSTNLPTPNLFLRPPIHQLNKQAFIVSARKNSRHTSSLRISPKAALQCAFFIASSLKIIPEPVSLMIKEGFEGGNGGGGLGFWNGSRGSGDGWGGKRRKKLQIWGFLGLIGIGVLFVVLMLGKDFEGFGELGLGVLGLGLLWILERDWKRGVKGWTLGFCSCALMVVLGLKREDLQKWCQRSRVHSHVMDLFRKKTRRRFL